MRTTVRIDDDLFSDLKEVARKERLSLTKTFNRLLREGLHSHASQRKRKHPFRQETFHMGKELFDYGEANHVAARLEDEATLWKMRLGK